MVEEEAVDVKLEDKDDVMLRVAVVVALAVMREHLNSLEESREQVMVGMTVVVVPLVMFPPDVMEVEEQMVEDELLNEVKEYEGEEVEEVTPVLSGTLDVVEPVDVVVRPVVDTPADEVELLQVSLLEEEVGSEENVVPCLSLRKYSGT